MLETGLSLPIAACIHRDLHSYGPYRSYYGAGLGPLYEGQKPQRKSAGEGPTLGTPDLGQKGHRGRPPRHVAPGQMGQEPGRLRGTGPNTEKPDNGLAETAKQKVEVFRKAFFSQLPLADLSDILTTFLSRQFGFPDFAEHEMLRCIRKAPPDKAPGPDGIPNKV
ncbi:uncharacterized protein KD926_002986 [Aspergillus affinis]|uniref:uncharacterized protein n=1 Tax=Aspergillus affinis TaxID=1070780 RepID=UPI0022FDC436|nr:uncharacterized protein KD926_002986 [Aspergillus affinis]KAI9035705.1 hypothetical protein KD926_002986 [Aspergillus affinis]